MLSYMRYPNVTREKARTLYLSGLSCAKVANVLDISRATAYIYISDIARPKRGYGDFWYKVRKTKKCWLWTGTHQRYGRFNGEEGPGTLAHRQSWILEYGPIPKGLCVLHKCDNTLCVRPSHLWLGTQKDNSQDMVLKGRAPHGLAKLSDDNVRQIRQRMNKRKRGDVTKMAAEFSIERSALYNIANGKAYKWVSV